MDGVPADTAVAEAEPVQQGEHKKHSIALSAMEDDTPGPATSRESMDLPSGTQKSPLPDGDTGDGQQTYTIDEAIETVGFGKYQIAVLLMAGLSWTADAMEMLLLSYLKARPEHNPRHALCGPRALNATAQSRVTLSRR